VATRGICLNHIEYGEQAIHHRKTERILLMLLAIFLSSNRSIITTRSGHCVNKVPQKCYSSSALISSCYLSVTAYGNYQCSPEMTSLQIDRATNAALHDELTQLHHVLMLCRMRYLQDAATIGNIGRLSLVAFVRSNSPITPKAETELGPPVEHGA